ncbi:polysaccharide biosynthesis tyrosine autokinase [Corallococcus macrosporus]|uniref:Polysaccharide biosynthesis tyrosine autokinase n=1 Tax=Corallococcus macrosporus TaxID=35 RepID=A0ABS3DPN6_9BACT|nr:polysaccharide biosynthesis tyrosine autokinase [Corallococcus macrosporus]MBN8233270.1 polysaccharide biosynthesis tyrosine autokinase [Corallococcus macrosporus]
MTSTSQRVAPPRPGPGAQDDELGLGRYLAILGERRGTIAASVALALAVGGLYLLTTAPVYRANALLQIEQKGSSLGQLDDLIPDAPGMAATEMEVLGSRALLGRVADTLHLGVSVEPHHFPGVGAAYARAHPGPELAPVPWWGRATYAWGGEELQVERLNVPEEWEDVPLTLVAEADGAYTLWGPDGRAVLHGVAGTGAQTEGDTAHEVELYVTRLRARPGTHFQVMRRSKLAVVEELQRALRMGEKGTGTGILNLTLEGPDPVQATTTLRTIADAYVRANVERRSDDAGRTLSFLDSQLPGLRQGLEQAEAALRDYRAKKGGVDLALEVQAVLNRGADLDKDISSLSLERSELRQRFTEHHPLLMATERKLARLRTERTALETRLKGIPDAERVSAQLTRDVKVANELYLQLNNKAQEYRVLKSSTITNARLIDAPVVTRLPVRPTKPDVFAVSLVLGLTFGVALAFARRSLNPGVTDPAALESALAVPVLASVPMGPRRTASPPGPSLILARSVPRDVTIESVRGLRTRLQLAMKGAGRNVVTLTGSSPGAGTSFVALNLAWVLAETGQRVLLVDANLRGGWLHRCFRDARVPGLHEVLRGTATLEEALLEGTVPPGLSFLGAGSLPPDPTELLAGASFDTFVARVSAEYDAVLFDTPCILAVTDAALVGRHAGVRLAVVRAQTQSLREVATALHQLEQSGVPANGVVLNGVPRSRTGRAVSGVYQYEYPSAS